MEAFVRDTVADSVHCNAPSMIGHMTMSLPYYIRPLSKLVTAMHQVEKKKKSCHSLLSYCVATHCTPVLRTT